MLAPDDHDRAGALPREAPCPSCAHDHLWLTCERCGCSTHRRNGVDTALNPGGSP